MKLNTACLVLVIFAGCVSADPKREEKYPTRRYDDAMDVEDFSVYYNLETNQTITEMMPRPWYRPGWMLRLPFIGGRCNCDGLYCSCCTGIRIQAFKFDRTTCVQLSYDPTQSLIDLEVKMNNQSVLKDTFSARNPPPFCVPVVVPYLPPGLVDMCVRLFDVAVVMQKLHVCMDMDTRVDKAPVLILHFDCMDMGIDGVSLSKPNGPNTGDPTAMEVGQLDSDIYDAVSETLPLTTPPMFNNSIKYI